MVDNRKQLDPEPWLGADGSRRSRWSRFAPRFAPRPQYSQDRSEYSTPQSGINLSHSDQRSIVNAVVNVLATPSSGDPA